MNVMTAFPKFLDIFFVSFTASFFYFGIISIFYSYMLSTFIIS